MPFIAGKPPYPIESSAAYSSRRTSDFQKRDIFYNNAACFLRLQSNLTVEWHVLPNQNTGANVTARVHAPSVFISRQAQADSGF